MMVPGIHMYDMKPAPAAPTDALMNTQIWLAEQISFFCPLIKVLLFFSFFSLSYNLHNIIYKRNCVQNNSGGFKLMHNNLVTKTVFHLLPVCSEGILVSLKSV